MKIKTQFILTMFLFGAVLAAISASALITSRKVEEASSQSNVAGSVARGAVELGYLANDYVIYRESQQLERWEARYASFSNDVSGLNVTDPEQQALVGNIKANTQRLRDVFDSIASAVGGVPGGAINSALLGVSWSRMSVQSQALISDASRLSQLLDTQVSQSHRLNDIVIIALIVVFTAYFLLNYFITQRRALKGLEKLQAGTAVIGSGDLNFRIEEKRNDEVGDLSRALNQMTTSLRVVTATKAELEIEIEERKKAEQKLAEQAAILANVNDAVIGYDADFRVTYWNKSAEKIYGYTAAEAMGKVSDSLLKPTYAGFKREDLVSRIMKEGHIEVESGRSTGDGCLIYVDTHVIAIKDTDKISGYVAVDRDITERKKTEAEISYLASFPELNPNPVIELEGSDNIKYANPAARKRFPDLMAQGSGHPFFIGISELIRKGEKSETRDINIGDCWYERVLVYMPLTQSYRLYVRDITERKKAEVELIRANAELEASNRELEAFSYSVSHDLRAPLRSMEGFSGALVEDYADKLDEQGKQYLRYVQESSELMARLIDDLLKLSRVTRTEMNYERVDLSALARSILTELEKTEPRRVVEVIIPPEIIAYGDRSLLRLALENLLGNAWKFSGKASSPMIEMGVIELKGKKTYFIHDNGVGFDMTYADKLFKPFQRLHRATEFTGTGIGLATVQRIIRRHGGEVWAESRAGEGATFYFTLA